MNIKKKWKGIKITHAAQDYFYNLIKKKNHIIGIQINIKKSGCAGFRYHLSFIEKNDLYKNHNFYIHSNKRIKIYIPIQYMLLLDDTEIDYTTTDGINMHIKFNNPKINEYCGCGESFNVLKKMSELPR